MHKRYVAITINIFASAMVHRLMLETGLRQSAIGFQFVAVHRAPLFDVPFDNRLKRFLPNVWDNLCHHVAAAFQHPKHNSLVWGAATALTARPLPADIGFVYLDDSAQRGFAVHARHVFSDLMPHAPRRLVSDAKLALKLLSWNPVAGRGMSRPLLKM